MTSKKKPSSPKRTDRERLTKDETDKILVYMLDGVLMNMVGEIFNQLAPNMFSKKDLKGRLYGMILNEVSVKKGRPIKATNISPALRHGRGSMWRMLTYTYQGTEDDWKRIQALQRLASSFYKKAKGVLDEHIDDIDTAVMPDVVEYNELAADGDYKELALKDGRLNQIQRKKRALEGRVHRKIPHIGETIEDAEDKAKFRGNKRSAELLKRLKEAEESTKGGLD